ncbi:MAG: hypothetical protein ACJA05_002289 [Porticoccus sp.]|jgi:hypothetical protein
MGDGTVVNKIEFFCDLLAAHAEALAALYGKINIKNII